MRYITLATLLLLSLLLYNCQTEQKEEIAVDFRTLRFEELFPYFLGTTDSLEEQQIVQMLEDSIALFHPKRDNDKYSSKYEYHFKERESVNKNNKTFKPSFLFTRTNHEDLYCCRTKECNFYDIEIKEKNRYYVEDRLIKYSFLIKTELSHFLLNPLNHFFLPQKRTIEMDSLRIYEGTKGYLQFYANIIPDSLGNKKVSLYNVKHGLNIILDTYNSIRNSVALTYWNTPYIELEFEKKLKVKEAIPILVVVCFDDKPLPIPPPPPPPGYENDIKEDWY